MWPRRETPTQFWAPLGLAFLSTFLAPAGIAAALLWQLTDGAALFLVTVACLLLRPVRAYAGLVRR